MSDGSYYDQFSTDELIGRLGEAEFLHMQAAHGVQAGDRSPWLLRQVASTDSTTHEILVVLQTRHAVPSTATRAAAIAAARSAQAHEMACQSFG